MTISKKNLYTAKKSDHNSIVAKKPVVVKKSKTSISLFAKKVEKANELLNNAKLLTT